MEKLKRIKESPPSAAEIEYLKDYKLPSYCHGHGEGDQHKHKHKDKDEDKDKKKKKDKHDDDDDDVAGAVEGSLLKSYTFKAIVQVAESYGQPPPAISKLIVVTK